MPYVVLMFCLRKDNDTVLINNKRDYNGGSKGCQEIRQPILEIEFH